MRRLLFVVVVVLAIPLTTASVASAAGNDRAAARLLDSVPLPSTAKPTDLGDRVRTYTTTDPPDAILIFLRDQLEAAGWTEKSVERAPANNNTSNDGIAADDNESNGTESSGGPETPGDRTTGDKSRSTSDSSNQQLTGPIRVRWTMNGSRLKATIDDVDVADPQQVQGEDARVTTIVLRARP